MFQEGLFVVIQNFRKKIYFYNVRNFKRIKFIYIDMIEKNIIYFESGVYFFLCDNFYFVYLCFFKLY